MKDILSKTMYLGLGLAAMTKERIDKFAKEVAERTDMTEEQGRKFVEYLQEESEKSKDRLQKAVDERVDKAMNKLPGIKRVKELEGRVGELEDRLAKHEAGHKKSTEGKSGS